MQPPTDAFAPARDVVATAEYIVEASLRRAGFDMTQTELRILRLIGNGHQTPADVRRAFGMVTQQFISKTMSELVRQGLIERTGDALDRRKISVAVTRRGRRAVALSNVWHDHFHVLAQDAFDDAARRILRAFDELMDSHGNLNVEKPLDAN